MDLEALSNLANLEDLCVPFYSIKIGEFFTLPGFIVHKEYYSSNIPIYAKSDIIGGITYPYDDTDYRAATIFIEENTLVYKVSKKDKLYKDYVQSFEAYYLAKLPKHE